MSISKLSAVCMASLALGSVVVARQAATPAQNLTSQDRAAIQELVTKYARALSTCASQEYASLFVPDGVFISDDFRGTRHRECTDPAAGSWWAAQSWRELVETEDFCLDKSRKRASGAEHAADGRDRAGARRCQGHHRTAQQRALRRRVRQDI